MSRFPTLRSLGIALAVVALPLMAGCGGVSQEEMDALEKQHQTTVASRSRACDARDIGNEQQVDVLFPFMVAANIFYSHKWPQRRRYSVGTGR